MFTLVSIGVLLAALVGGFKCGMSAEAMLIASALFAIAGSITTSALNIVDRMPDKK